MMRGIYKTFKKEIQKAIKEIVEKHGVSPMNMLTTLKGEVFSEYMTRLEAIAKRLSDDFDIDPENIYQMAENFYSEANEFICPDYNCTTGESLASYLNRQLIEAGYQTVEADALDLLTDEIRKLTFGKERDTVN